MKMNNRTMNGAHAHHLVLFPILGRKGAGTATVIANNTGNMHFPWPCVAACICATVRCWGVDGSKSSVPMTEMTPTCNASSSAPPFLCISAFYPSLGVGQMLCITTLLRASTWTPGHLNETHLNYVNQWWRRASSPATAVSAFPSSRQFRLHGRSRHMLT